VVIALQISVLAKNESHTSQLLELAIVKGAQIPCLKELAVLKNMPDKVWKNIEERYPELRKKYASTIDAILSKEFTIRYENEQQLKTSPQRLQIFQENADFIYNVIQLKGCFPGERMIGVDEDGLTNGDLCPYRSTKTKLSLLHYSFGFSDFEKYLIEAIQTGYIHPR
jgi:hypothetical protein